MDKLKKAAGAAPASPHPLAAARKYSVYDKDRMAKHRASSHDVSGSEPDDDSLTDFTKTDLLAFKSTFAKPKYANTYRMEPYRKFEPHVVKKKVEEILKIASRWVWDVARDNWIQGQQETENYVVVALIIACYYE